MKILLANVSGILDEAALSARIRQLPAEMQARALKYRSASAAAAFCMGRLMLRAAILDSGFPEAQWLNIRYSANGKPLLDGLFFNIAHSGDYVMLAYSLDMPVGIDIECPRAINLPDFKPWFRPGEWLEITGDPSPATKLYWYWVRKESILKAEDLPLKALTNIRILSDGVGDTGDNSRRWILQEFPGSFNFTGVIATEKGLDNIEVSAFAVK